MQSNIVINCKSGVNKTIVTHKSIMKHVSTFLSVFSPLVSQSQVSKLKVEWQRVVPTVVEVGGGICFVRR